jgi:hypothetical protein
MGTTENKPDQLHKSESPNRVLLIIKIVLLEIFAILAGVSFFMIVHGLLYGIYWTAPYWKFTRTLLVKVTGFSETHRFIKTQQITWQRAIFLFPKVIILLAFLVFGLWLLFHDGFCGQNLFCLARINGE